MTSIQIFSSVRVFSFFCCIFDGLFFFLFFSGCYAAVAFKKDAFQICISVSSLRDPHLNFGPFGTGLGRPRAAALAAVPRASASTPSPSPAPLHPARRTRAARSAAPRPGPRGVGEPGGAGTSPLHTTPRLSPGSKSAGRAGWGE